MASSSCSSSVTPTPVLDEIVALSGETEISKVIKIFIEQQITKEKAFIKYIHDKIADVKASLTREINPICRIHLFPYGVSRWCMTRSSTKELLSPFKNPKQVLRLRRKLFDNLCLVESKHQSLINFLKLKHTLKKKLHKLWLKQWSSTWARPERLWVGVTRPTINQDTPFELKRQFLKELYDNTFSGSEHEDANEHIEKLRNQPSGSITTWEVLKAKFLNKYYSPAHTIKKMEEINNFQQESDESLFRAWERFKELLIKAAGLGFYQRNNEKSLYPARRDTMEESLSKFIAESAKRHEENSNNIKEIRAFTDAAIKIKEHRSKPWNWFGSLPSSTETNSRDQVKSISTATADLSEIRSIEHNPYAISSPHHKFIYPETVPFPRKLHNYCCDDLKKARGVSLVDLRASVNVMPFFTYTKLSIGDLSHTRMTIELADRTIKQPKGIAANMLVRIGKFVLPIDFIILEIPKDDDVSLILGRPFLSTAHLKIDVYRRKVTLRVGDEKLVFKSIKPASSIIKRVFMDE
uniref:Retrotransposon gag domain-containing protein n=1 Tax=Tanacetum cinerariifolium TaxID=118510 RepID=A0A699H9D7_TANCI|nr:hypothetical protein [Tanacetum cinerariifolium]